MSILLAVCEFIRNNWFASAIVGGITWDATKQELLEPFMQKLEFLFKNKSQCEQYLKAMVEIKAKNVKKPYRDIIDLYEEILGESVDEKTANILTNNIKEFILQNNDTINKLYKEQGENTIGIKIKDQHAERDINNVSNVGEINITNN